MKINNKVIKKFKQMINWIMTYMMGKPMNLINRKILTNQILKKMHKNKRLLMKQ